jgi:hypothetical protein
MHRIHDSFALFRVAALCSMIGMHAGAEEADDIKPNTID